MINILKLRKIEKEKKLQQEKVESEEKITEKIPEQNIDEKIIEEIAEEINSVPDSPGNEKLTPSEIFLNMPQDIEVVDETVEIQQFSSPVAEDDLPDQTDSWIAALDEQSVDMQELGTSMEEDPGIETAAGKEEIPSAAPELDPAEAFRQALIEEVLRDESMVTRAQVREEEENKNSSKKDAASAAPVNSVSENPSPVEVSSVEKVPAEEKVLPAVPVSEVKTPEKKQDIKKTEVSQPQQPVGAHEAKTHEAKAEAKAHEAVVQLVGFTLGKECYGVDITRIREINRMTEITRVPRAPEFIEGVINLRGSVIPVINLRKKVKMPAREYDKDTRIIIVELSGKTIGFIVDAVKEVLRIPESVLAPPPVIAVGKNADYITAVAKVEDELVILLDPDKVLSREETQKLEESDGKKLKK